MTLQRPKISVVTCCYNHAPYLERTIASVLCQNYPNLEYIIIDGGSTDGSKEIIQRYTPQLAYWVSEPDEGQTHALIKGFNKATGDIFCWLCSDDLLEPWTLDDVATFFQRHPKARVVYGDATWIDERDRVVRKKLEHRYNRFIWMHDHNYIPQPSTFWRRDLYLEVNGLDPRFNLAMDADLWARFAEVTEIHHVDRPWSRLRLYPAQKNQRLRERSNQEDRIIRQRYIDERSQWMNRSLGVYAKGLRVGWKVLTGRYW